MSLKIRQEQFETFRESQVQRIAERLADDVRTRNLNDSSSNEYVEVVQRARIIIRQAEEFGLTTSKDLTAFHRIMVATSERFDKHPRVLEILRDSRLNSTRKLDLALHVAAQLGWPDQ